MQKISKVIDVLSREYNFSAEAGLKLYMDSLKKKEKKVRKVEVEDIFTEMSRDENVDSVVVEKVKEKKPRTEKQLAAFEAMKAKRAANIEAKKVEKEGEKVEKEGEKVEKEGENVEVEKVEKAKKEKKEKKAKVEKTEKVEKEKKPRTEKQMAAFEAMKAKRAANLQAKKEAKENVPVVDEVVEPVEIQEEMQEEVQGDTESDEVSVKKFDHKGKEYLISKENILYDPENEEAVGKWNEEKQEIESCEELEEEEIVE
jgi:hypothetical protein